MVAAFLSIFLKSGKVEPLQSFDWDTWLDASWIASLGQPEYVADAPIEAIVQQHVEAVTALGGMTTPDQGIWIQVGNQVLSAHQGTTPLSAASLTKIATTLAALETWDPSHQFETLISTTGSIQNGVLDGDLVVQGGGDPLFVWEEAIALANTLQQVGITRVTGDLVVTDSFAMNFKTDPATTGELLKQGMNQTLWNEEVETQYATLPSGTPRPTLDIEGDIRVITAEEVANLGAKPLIRHRSLPLVGLLKAMNTYSNNVMADMVADAVGGPQVVAEKSSKAARFPLEEIQLINGSGLGNENRISPRGVGAMLQEIQRDAQAHQLTIGDLFPVIGRERGTLKGRGIPTGSVVKTGTLDDVSSLAGVLPTRDRGPVWFAIINVGTADLDALRQQQDVLLNALIEQWGEATPLPMEITPAVTDPATYQLGNPNRNQVLR